MSWWSGADGAWVFPWVILPLFIFAARVADVTLGTLRIIFVSRGLRWLAPAIGFVEILIWLAAIGQIMQNLNNVYYYLAYALGFATGTFVGISIENRLAMGVSLIRIIAQSSPGKLIQALKEAGYGVTTLNGEGIFQPVKVIFSIVKRKELRQVLALLKIHNPKAVYTIEDVRFASDCSSFAPECNRFEWTLFKGARKGK